MGGGTLAFMAPEQIGKFLGPDSSIRVDHSADIYAIGPPPFTASSSDAIPIKRKTMTVDYESEN